MAMLNYQRLYYTLQDLTRSLHKESLEKITRSLQEDPNGKAPTVTELAGSICKESKSLERFNKILAHPQNNSQDLYTRTLSRNLYPLKELTRSLSKDPSSFVCSN